MNCEKVLAALATGGLVARCRARRHVAGCRDCADAERRLREITRALACAPPLTAAQRALWAAASTEAAASRRWQAWVYPLGLAAAAVLFGVIALKLWVPQLGGGDDRLRITNVVPEPPAVSPVQGSERGKLADEMLAKLDRLDRELTDLRRAGDLLDVRKDADALWEQYSPRKRSTL
jgi:hypothetical protein